jgi:hypothetical protein
VQTLDPILSGNAWFVARTVLEPRWNCEVELHQMQQQKASLTFQHFLMYPLHLLL